MTLANADFLVFAPNPWHDLWRNRQQIFSRLAGPHRVLYVEPERASLRDWRQHRRGLADLRRPAVIEELPNLWLYRSPPWLPIRGTGGPWDGAMDRLLAWHLQWTMRMLGFGRPAGDPANERIGEPTDQPTHQPATPPQFQVPNPKFQIPNPNLPILWLYRPNHWRWAAASFPHRLLVYHITDDYTAFGHMPSDRRQALIQAERELLAAADLTLVTSPRLLQLKHSHARRIELVPNAVDYQAFQQALANPLPPGQLPQIRQTTLPADHQVSDSQSQLPTSNFQILNPPLLGYSGHISNRLDLELLHDLALARPQWQLVLAGSRWDADCATELATLEALPNVHFLGLLPVSDVPHFIAGCDVCLAPYRVNDETRAISSLKLYEYLAAGKPVISADVPAARELVDVVSIAGPDVASWVTEVEEALGQAADPAQVMARQAVAAANTWEERVGRIAAILNLDADKRGLHRS